MKTGVKINDQIISFIKMNIKSKLCEINYDKNAFKNILLVPLDS